MTTPRKRNPSRFPHTISVSERTWRMWQDLSEQEVPTGWARDEVIVPKTVELWQAKHGAPVILERELFEQTLGATPVGPSDVGAVDLAALDSLPDPGRVWTANEPATCHNCGETIPAGDKMIIRTKTGGGRQYLHTPGICY